MKLTIMEQRNNEQRPATFLDMVAAVFLHFAFWLLLFSMFQLKMGVVSVGLMIILPVLMVPAARQKVFGKYLVFYVLVLVALVTLLGFRFFSKAFLELLNEVISGINVSSGFRFVPFHTEIAAGRELFYGLTAEAVLMGLTSAVLADSAVNKRLLPVVLLTVLPVTAGFLLLLRPHLVWVALFLLAQMFLVIHCSAGTERSGLRETGLLLQMTGSTLALILLFLALFYNYSGSARVQTLRENLTDRIATIRYAPKTAVEPMTGGNLNKAGSLHYKGDTAFLITMEQPSPGYLRDFVGSRFENGTWLPLSEEAMTGKYLGLDQWLAQRNFYPWMQLNTLYALDAGRTGSAAKTQTVTVENVGLSSDRFYLFYEAVPTEELLNDSKPFEQALLAKGWKGQREYTYTTYTPIFEDYGAEDLSNWVKTLSSQEGYEQYKAVESLYASFVHDNYLEVDEPYVDVVEATGIKTSGNSRYQDIAYNVRKYFQDHFTYSETLEPLEKGEDALIQFATVTRSGYDAHFATLATLMFRDAGVPSRYMEGYYLSPKDMSAYSNTKDVSLELDDSNAHAWVEIYEDQVGWVPVEVTPGYYTLEEEETPQMTESVKRISKRSPRPYYDEVPLPEQEHITPPVEQKKDHTWVKWVLGVVVFLLFCFAFLFGGKKYLEKRIMTADSPEATRFGYRFLMWLFRRRKLPVEKENPFALVPVLGEEYENYINLVYQDVYSGESGQLTEDQRKACGEYVMRQWKNGKTSSSKDRPLPTEE